MTGCNRGKTLGKSLTELFRIQSFDRFWKSFQLVHAGNQIVFCLPDFFSSVSNCIQNFAPSLDKLFVAHNPEFLEFFALILSAVPTLSPWTLRNPFGHVGHPGTGFGQSPFFGSVGQL
jgi:hypothetical protein